MWLSKKIWAEIALIKNDIFDCIKSISKLRIDSINDHDAQIKSLRDELAHFKQSYMYDHSQLKTYTIEQVNKLGQEKVGYEAWEMLVNSHREVLARIEHGIAELQKPKVNECWLVEYNGHELKGFTENFSDLHIRFLPQENAPVKAVRITEVKPIRQL